MARVFTRKEILERLKDTTNRGKPILGAGASSGLIGKCAEIGGADLIIVYCTGLSRKMGLPTRRIGDANNIVIEMGREVGQVLEDVPLIGGLDANDPYYMDINRQIDRHIEAGFSGIINNPTVGSHFMPWRNVYDPTGIKFSREVKMISLCHERGLFTITYCFEPEDCVRMAVAGADAIVAHVGPTVGGLEGFNAPDMEKCCERAEELIQAAKKANPDVICLAHGGTFSKPADTRVLYEKTSAVGFVGASSVERIPVEKAIMDAVKKFKAIPMPKKAG